MNILRQGLDLVFVGVEVMQSVVEGADFVGQRDDLVVGDVQGMQVSVTVYRAFVPQ